MSTITRNEDVLSTYMQQWDSLETELRNEDIEEKTKKVALDRFSEMKKAIIEDANALKGVIEYSSYVGMLAKSTEDLASFVIEAKIHDLVFGDRQNKLFEEEEKSKEGLESFSADDFLKAIAEDSLEI